MSYFMRFIVTEQSPPSLDDIQAVLQAFDSAYFVVMDDADPTIGDLYYGDEVYAELEINLPGDPLCDEDIADLAEEVLKQDDPNRDVVLEMLDQAIGILVIHVLRAAHEDYARLAVLIEWLFDMFAGMLQVDEEGFFNSEGKVITLL
jgi:hypothetical protein